MRLDKLAVILVRCHHVDVKPFAGEASGRRTYHIVGFKPHDHEYRDVHGLDYCRQRLERVYHQLRGFSAVGLVLRIHFIAESSSGRVKAHSDMCRLLPLDYIEKIFCESEKYSSIHSRGIDHGPSEECIVHFKNQSVTIDQK